MHVHMHACTRVLSAECRVLPSSPESCLSASCDGHLSLPSLPISPDTPQWKCLSVRVMHRIELVIPTPVGLVTRTLSKFVA